MSSGLSGSQAIALEIARRKAQLEWLKNDPPSAQIQREIEQRKAERARCKARLRLVWVAPAVQSNEQQEEKRGGCKNGEK